MRARLFDIKRNCSEDGPGIRTTVFFKGCPLACTWCHNPEGLHAALSLSHRRERCHPTGCGMPCIAICPNQALTLDDGRVELTRQRCQRCDLCLPDCPHQALAPVGFELDVEALLYRLAIDLPFFRASGGGVTVSGGEPTAQMAFLGVLLARLREMGVDTALETCGHFPFAPFARQVLPHLCRIYFDVKLVDEEEHQRHTGRSNRLILANLTRLAAQKQVALQVRVPLVPGITATPANLRAIGALLRSLSMTQVTLLPYNPTGVDKYGPLGLPPPGFSGWQNDKEVEDSVRFFFS